jgi:tetratricopeptide (TPR) repeat protein
VARKPVVFLRYEYAKILGRLVIDASRYYYCVLSRFDIAFGFAQSALDIFESLVMLSPDKWKTAQGLIPPYRGALPEIKRIDFTLCEERSDCLHSLGKILRYQGHLAKSEETLKLALQMRQSLSIDSFQVADTLHELGVLKLRLHEVALAEDYLQKSLSLKTSIGAPNRSRAETGEAATFHQLASVAIIKKKYDEAQHLLLKALAIESSNFGSDVARAATLHQLGRVNIRKGRLHDAETHLNEALEIYQRIYGEHRCLYHVNVASVHRQLGSTASALQNYDEACKQYSKALSIHENICKETVSDMISNYQLRCDSHHLEVLQDLKSLAQAYSMKKEGLQIAFDLFKKGKLIAEKLIDTMSHRKREIAREDMLQNEEIYPNEISILKSTISKLLLNTLYSLRAIAKSIGDVEMSAEYAKELQILKKQLDPKDLCGAFSNLKSLQEKACENPMDLTIASKLLSTRSLLRNVLSSVCLQQSSSESLKELNECIMKILSDPEMKFGSMEVSDSKLFILLEIFIKKLTDLSGKAKSLISESSMVNRDRCLEYNIMYKEIVDECWVVSDDIRQSMRQRGYSVTDVK